MIYQQLGIAANNKIKHFGVKQVKILIIIIISGIINMSILVRKMKIRFRSFPIKFC